MSLVFSIFAFVLTLKFGAGLVAGAFIPAVKRGIVAGVAAVRRKLKV